MLCYILISHMHCSLDSGFLPFCLDWADVVTKCCSFFFTTVCNVTRIVGNLIHIWNGQPHLLVISLQYSDIHVVA